jgi:magnesium chelatase family protein
MTRQGRLNGRMTGEALRAQVSLTDVTRRHVQVLAELERASGRGLERLLRVARTIADLAGADVVSVDHLDEAAWFRSSESRAMTVRAV